jgi:hypothetical protein
MFIPTNLKSHITMAQFAWPQSNKYDSALLCLLTQNTDAVLSQSSRPGVCLDEMHTAAKFTCVICIQSTLTKISENTKHVLSHICLIGHNVLGYKILFVKCLCRLLKFSQKSIYLRKWHFVLWPLEGSFIWGDGVHKLQDFIKMTEPFLRNSCFCGPLHICISS